MRFLHDGPLFLPPGTNKPPRSDRRRHERPLSVTQTSPFRDGTLGWGPSPREWMCGGGAGPINDPACGPSAVRPFDKLRAGTAGRCWERGRPGRLPAERQGIGAPGNV